MSNARDVDEMWPSKWATVVALTATLGLALGGCGPSLPTGDSRDGSVSDASVDGIPPPTDRVELIPFGPSSFIMGEEEYPRPPTPVRVLPFRLARTETTVAQYRRCVEAGACEEPPLALPPPSPRIVPEEHGGPLPDPMPCNYHQAGRDHHPVNCIDWHAARRFAAWATPCGRLPSEAEWEYAARANNGSSDYPWGDEAASCRHAVFLTNHDRFYCPPIGKGTRPVCSARAGVSPDGLCDLLGNVGEWVEDIFVYVYDCGVMDEEWREAAGCAETDRRPETSAAWVSGEGELFSDDSPSLLRPVRGGSWLSNAVDPLSGLYPITGRSRDILSGISQRIDTGFRIAAAPIDDPACEGEGGSE